MQQMGMGQMDGGAGINKANRKEGGRGEKTLGRVSATQEALEGEGNENQDRVSNPGQVP